MFAPMDDPFIQLNRVEIAEKLRLTERGEQQGRINLPSSTLRTLDNVEAEVASFIEDHHSRAQIDAANSIRTYDERLNGLTLLSKLSSIGTQARVAVTDFHVPTAADANLVEQSSQLVERAPVLHRHW